MSAHGQPNPPNTSLTSLLGLGGQPPSMWSPTPVRGRRVVAAFIDLIPPGLVTVGLAERNTADGLTIELSGWRFVVASLIGLAYWFVSELFTQTTLGKRLMGLRVIGVDGRDAGRGAIVVRSVLRFVDSLPLLYLVGFVTMLATPKDQRVGDLVAKTRVVRYRDVPTVSPTAPDEPLHTPGPPPRRNTMVALAIAAVVSVVGVVTIVTSSDQVDEAEQAEQAEQAARIGAFDLDDEVTPYAVGVAEGPFLELDAEAIVAELVPGVATVAEVESLFTDLREQYGGIGVVELADRTVRRDQTIADLGDRRDIVEFLFDAEFGNGDGTILLGVAVYEGELKLLGWSINCEGCLAFGA